MTRRNVPGFRSQSLMNYIKQQVCCAYMIAYTCVCVKVCVCMCSCVCRCVLYRCVYGTGVCMCLCECDRERDLSTTCTFPQWIGSNTRAKEVRRTLIDVNLEQEE